MTSQQIKSYVSLRQFDQISRFEMVSDEQTVRSYQFTEELQTIGARLLSIVASGAGAWAVIGERGMGKSHLLALLRSLANEPHLIKLLDDGEASATFERLAMQKLPPQGLATLTIGFDPEKGLNFLKVFPKWAELDGEMPASTITPQLDELIEQHISQATRFALFIDGISPYLTHPQQ